MYIIDTRRFTKTGKHGYILPRTAHPMVKLFYRRYATSEVEEAPISLEVPKVEKKVRIKKRVALLNPPRCILCGTCIDVCYWKALNINNKKIMINEEMCRGCGACVKNCPSKVLALVVVE